MSAEQALREGNLDEALAEVQKKVRAEPAESKHRIFLFQLLAVRGEWDRALTQLGVLGEMDAGTLAMVQTYREALRCEVLRREIFLGKRSPIVFGEPGQWVAMLLEALRLTAEGRHAESQELRTRAFDEAPASSGKIDGEPFEWIADADPRIGPMIEAVVNGRYCWVPFQNVAQLRLEEPNDLRDVVWMPAYFTWTNGGASAALIPCRYPGSEHSEDPAIRLARRTEWAECAADLFLGQGQRMLATDIGEFPLMDVRQIDLDVAGEQATAGS